MKRLSGVLTTIAFALLPLGRTFAQQYSLDWYKIAGGGGTSSGGQYSLSGTIGQFDAGQINGGNYAIEGGFWSAVGSVPAVGAPSLTIQLINANTVSVSWPSPSSGFVLQQNSDVSSLNGWLAFGGTINDNGATKSIIINRPIGSLFFRLKKE